MRVSDLTKGMLVQPKDGFVFSVWTSGYYKNEGSYQQLECRRRHRKHAYREPNRKVFKNPVIYMGKAPRTEAGRASQYEARHEAFVTFAGRKMRVAPEAWRNMEPVRD